MNNHESLLVHVAQLYYQQNLNQSEISKIVGLSRPTVSRMLEEAREVGIVEIIVHDPIRKNNDLSARLRDQLGLREALIISGKYQHDVALEKCANEAAQFVSSILDNNMSIGFSWGRAIRAVCNAFQSSEYYNVTVVQMAGCLSVGDPTYINTHIKSACMINRRFFIYYIKLEFLKLKANNILNNFCIYFIWAIS